MARGDEYAAPLCRCRSPLCKRHQLLQQRSSFELHRSQLHEGAVGHAGKVAAIRPADRMRSSRCGLPRESSEIPRGWLETDFDPAQPQNREAPIARGGVRHFHHPAAPGAVTLSAASDSTQAPWRRRAQTTCPGRLLKPPADAFGNGAHGFLLLNVSTSNARALFTVAVNASKPPFV